MGPYSRPVAVSTSSTDDRRVRGSVSSSLKLFARVSSEHECRQGHGWWDDKVHTSTTGGRVLYSGSSSGSVGSVETRGSSVITGFCFHSPVTVTFRPKKTFRLERKKKGEIDCTTLKCCVGTHERLSLHLLSLLFTSSLSLLTPPFCSFLLCPPLTVTSSLWEKDRWGFLVRTDFKNKPKVDFVMKVIGGTRFIDLVVPRNINCPKKSPESLESY